MTTLVLVHGGWGGGWCWRDASRLLRADRHEVYPQSLTGVAERAHVPPQSVAYSTHIAGVAGLLAFEELRGLVLAGRSYGGMVIAGVADREPDRIAGMTNFDAFLPAAQNMNRPFHKITAGLRARADWTMSELDAFHDVFHSQPERGRLQQSATRFCDESVRCVLDFLLRRTQTRQYDRWNLPL